MCLIDPVGDVYACPFAIHDAFLAGNARSTGGFAGVWRESELFQELRGPQSTGLCGSCQFYDSCRGGCMAAKFFTGLPLEGPDPECALGHGEMLLAQRTEAVGAPRPSQDHSRRGASRLLSVIEHVPDRACDENPLVGFFANAPSEPVHG